MRFSRSFIGRRRHKNDCTAGKIYSKTYLFMSSETGKMPNAVTNSKFIFTSTAKLLSTSAPTSSPNYSPSLSGIVSPSG